MAQCSYWENGCPELDESSASAFTRGMSTAASLFAVCSTASRGPNRVFDVKEIKTVPYALLSHPLVKRLIETIRREFLAHMPLWNEVDLTRIRDAFRNDYKGARVWAALGGDTRAVGEWRIDYGANRADALHRAVPLRGTCPARASGVTRNSQPTRRKNSAKR